jgi:hypothetical protein
VIQGDLIVDIALDLKAAGKNAAQRAFGSRQSAAEQLAQPAQLRRTVPYPAPGHLPGRQGAAAVVKHRAHQHLADEGRAAPIAQA